jgi:hypothetical protein
MSKPIMDDVCISLADGTPRLSHRRSHYAVFLQHIRFHPTVHTDTMTVEAAGLILPSDVLIIVMENLGIEDLINLSCTCKFVNLLVN